jgi:hypothetical protein
MLTMAAIENKLLLTLAEGFERDPRGFITLPKETVDCSDARVLVADLRNRGYVDEQVRGVVRLTLRGYELFRSRLPMSA